MNEYWSLVVTCAMWVLVVLSFFVGGLAYILLLAFADDADGPEPLGTIGVALISTAVFILAGCYLHVYVHG